MFHNMKKYEIKLHLGGFYMVNEYSVFMQFMLELVNNGEGLK